MDTPSSRNNVEQVKPAGTLLATPPHGFESITPQQIINNGQEAEQKGKLTLKTKIIAGLAGLGIVGASAFGIGFANSGEKGPAEQPVATAPGEPVESQSPVEANPTPSEVATNNPEATGEYTVESLEIPAGLDSQTLGKILIEDRLNAWYNASASDQLRATRREANKTWAELLPEVAEKNREVFANALFTPEWRSNQQLAHLVDSIADVNLEVLDAYVKTAWNGDEVKENKEGYRQWQDIRSITETPDGNPNDENREIVVTVVTKDNSDMNSVPSATSGLDALYHFSLRTVDGKEKISNIVVTR